jgi:hypothetical protein
MLKSLCILAISTLLSLAEVIEAIKRNFVSDYLFILSNDTSWGDSSTSQGPSVLGSEKEVWFAAIDDSEISIVSVDDLIVTVSEEEEADFALWAVTLSCSLYTIDLVGEVIYQRVVDSDQAIISSWISSLHALTKSVGGFEKKTCLGVARTIHQDTDWGRIQTWWSCRGTIPRLTQPARYLREQGSWLRWSSKC